MQSNRRMTARGRTAAGQSTGWQSMPVVTLLLSALLLCTTGCTLTPLAGSDRREAEPETVRTNAHADEQIALDFVNAIVQVESLAPDQTLLQFARGDSQDPVLDALLTMLSAVGYGIRRVDPAADASGLVMHRVVSRGDRSRQHEISIGEVGFRRAYRDVGSRQVQPVSELLVRGADASRIRMMDNVLFGLESRPGTPTLPSRFLDRYGYLLANARSEGAGSFEGFTEIIAHLVDFERGSDRLDAADVVMIDDVLERFDAATDLIAVTGYSINGATDADRRMALRRARRVKAAFTAVGVPAEQVLVDGAGGLTDEAANPARAARLRLLRRVPS